MINDMDVEAMELFTSSAARLIAVVSGLDPVQLDCATAPGEWSIRELIHHVTDDCDVWSMLLKKALATPGAGVRFEGFPGNEAWANALDFRSRDVTLALTLNQAHHAYLAQLLTHFPGRWENRVVILDAQGCPVQEINVREILMMLAEHMLEHLDTIETILARKQLN